MIYGTNMLSGAVEEPDSEVNFTAGLETQEQFDFQVKASVVGTAVVFEKDG